MHRLFVALKPPRPVRDHLLAMAGGIAGARWQDDDQLHLTVRFIGEVDRPIAEDVAAALGQVDAALPPLTLAGIGRFEKKGRTEALWAGVAPVAPLARLHAKVDRAIVRAGLPPERRAYLPHVTLARFSRTGGDQAALARFLAAGAALTSSPFRIDHLVLFESTLGQNGAAYQTIARWPLRHAPA